ncbi:hypothetical protein LY90DRAFT_33616 [Neocallimastix californiae]|uniref:G-protein coupled receptors family 3 profile domain-containing protein n=1 Tax=Neocallimastix californiae TaxID=1754190 RepID=A0A1Y2C3G9_9FUNG|nr:hypothetical protein LY90DRAFT_33616 [Neocallimastix californiae]|eukprot:ORY41434.1 hypothetical protein LY90DRAFT_33616 [Neocallimastix californiae]
MKTINIVNSKFINNSGSRGPVLNILNYSENYIINFNDTYFENNHANYYGGVVYSHRYFYPEDYIPQYNDYYFNNCVFINNTAKKGDISFSYEKRHEPIFSNIKELRKIKGAFVTNPSYIELTPDSKKSVTLYSGEKIPFEIKFKIFDEYNNIINEEAFETIDDMMLFDLELNDTANGKILGSPVYNCYVGYCTIPQIKILGKAGSYKLYYKLKTFGNYEPFKNSFGEIDINIKYCSNSSYLYQDIEKAGFKSCYLPQCETSCNKGRCVNMNVCDCSSTPYKGLYCNEYYIEEKSTAFMVFLKIISIILTIITIAFIIGIIKNRNDQKIKAASYNFLILILVGIIFNNIYLWILSMKETTILTCTYEYLFNYLGFSLVFGSIFVKTLRIFIIFEKINNSILVRNNIMYLIVLTILLYHVITVIFWIIFDNITVAKRYTVKEREYKQCTYPIWKKINTLFNLSLLLVDVSFSYANRHVKKNFKEHLTIPVYVYIVLTILMEFIDVDYEETQYVFDSFMMIINTSVILFFIFIRRYYKILLFNKTNANHIPLFISSNDLLRENKRVHY